MIKNRTFWEVFCKDDEPPCGYAPSHTKYSQQILFSTCFLIPIISTLRDDSKRLDSHTDKPGSSALSPLPCILTIIKVNVLWDLVPGAVVEMADLLLVLHHACWLAFLLVLQGNVVLDSFKVLPMLKNKSNKSKQSKSLFVRQLKQPEGFGGYFWEVSFQCQNSTAKEWQYFPFLCVKCIMDANYGCHLLIGLFQNKMYITSNFFKGQLYSNALSGRTENTDFVTQLSLLHSLLSPLFIPQYTSNLGLMLCLTTSTYREFHIWVISATSEFQAMKGKLVVPTEEMLLHEKLIAREK